MNKCKSCLSIADYAYISETGHIELEGPAAELATNDAVRRTYLGIHWIDELAKNDKNCHTRSYTDAIKRLCGSFNDRIFADFNPQKPPIDLSLKDLQELLVNLSDLRGKVTGISGRVM